MTISVKVTGTMEMVRTGTSIETLKFGKLGTMIASCEVRDYEQLNAKRYELHGITQQQLAAAVGPELRGKEATLENLWTAAKCAGLGTVIKPKGRKLEFQAETR